MRTAITFDDVLIVPQYSEVTPDMVSTQTTLVKGINLDIPIISAPMDSVTEVEMATAMAEEGGIGILHKNMGHDEQIRQAYDIKKWGHKLGVAISPTRYTDRMVEELVDTGVDVFVLDSAHGHSKNVIEALERLKKLTDTPVIVGNIATASAAIELYNAGADALKVGIGPGSICTTRIVAGVGVPQITAIQDVANANGGKLDIPVIADGGIRYSGDIAKAIMAGASCVMLGSLLAGHDEVPHYKGVIIDGKRYVPYRGMGSEGAMGDGSGDRYSQDGSNKFVPEGIEGCVPYKGKVADTLYQMVGGLKSAMGYIGCATIEEMIEQGKSYFHMEGFVGVSPNSLRENHPHDVQITKEAPNYAI